MEVMERLGESGERLGGLRGDMRERNRGRLDISGRREQHQCRCVNHSPLLTIAACK